MQDNQITLQGDRAIAEYLPRSIDVTYRSEKITIDQYFNRHPWMAAGLLVFFPPVFILVALCRPSIEEPIYGTYFNRAGSFDF